MRPKSAGSPEAVVEHVGSGPGYGHHFALVYLGFGDIDNGICWTEKARQQRFPMMARLKVDPRFGRIGRPPRFREMMRKVGLQ
jgi:hypothetical protein